MHFLLFNDPALKSCVEEKETVGELYVSENINSVTAQCDHSRSKAL